MQALAAVLGGCQSLHTNSYDEALGLPTSEAATIALRTQQVIAHESGVADFVDALGGSYAIEALTDRIEHEANRYLARIDELGGMVAAIEQGFPQREIQSSAYELPARGREEAAHHRRRERVRAGLAARRRCMKIDPKIEREQVERVRAVRARRDAEPSTPRRSRASRPRRAARTTCCRRSSTR